MRLLPPPQRAVISEAACFDTAGVGQLYLAMPKRDDRLPYHAQNLFERATVEVRDGPGLFALSSFAQGLDEPLPNEACLADPQGYALAVDARGIRLHAAAAEGLFYGMLTLGQCLGQGTVLPAMELGDKPDLPVRCTQYDLRQTHPDFERLRAYIPEMARYKYNALLIEYEDKFPFEHMPYLCNRNTCLTAEQVRLLRDEARLWFMEVIPLQQAFGHIEYVLKQPQFRALRMTPDDVGEMCPCRSGARELACALIDEMAAQHPDSRYLHIGCDEVWSLGRCPDCQGEKTRERQFVDFVNELIAHVDALGKTPLVWHDMLMKCSDQELALLDRRCVVVIWTYLPKGSGDIVRHFSQRLNALGIPFWGAHAARCFDWVDIQNYPVLANRFANIEDMTGATLECGGQGIVTTNWTAAFSLGCPYGVFETTWYPMLYAAAAAWNFGPGRENFLGDFFTLWHGLPQNTLPHGHNTDYYRLVAGMAGGLAKHPEAAELFDMMLHYEAVAEGGDVLRRYLYRLGLYPHDEAERACIAGRYKPHRKAVQALRAPFEALVGRYLRPDMAKAFVAARFYLEDHFHEAVYAPLLIETEGQGHATGL